MMQKLIKYKYRLLMISLLLIGCGTKNAGVRQSDFESDLRNDNYVAAIMSHYPSLYLRGVSDKDIILPGPPEGLFYYTINATYKSDTLSILLSSLSELVNISKISNQPIDSASLASVIKGKSLIPLTDIAFRKATIVKPMASIDTVKLKGKEYFLNYYFKSTGAQKIRLTHEEEIYIIDILSDWSLPVDFDDYNGLYKVRLETK